MTDVVSAPTDSSRRGQGVRDDPDVSASSDAGLLIAITRRRSDALAEAYRRHGGAAFALARRLLNDNEMAEEVLQEVFLRLWNDPERFDPERGSLRSYLLAQTHGRSVDLIRSETSRRRREERDAHRTPHLTVDIEREVVESSVAQQVKEVVAGLPVEERKAIELAYFGGHTYREVAQLLDEPEGTVKSRIRAGLKRMRTGGDQAWLEG